MLLPGDPAHRAFQDNFPKVWKPRLTVCRENETARWKEKQCPLFLAPDLTQTNKRLYTCQQVHQTTTTGAAAVCRPRVRSQHSTIISQPSIEAAAFRKRFEAGCVTVPLDPKNCLRDWLLGHIRGMDRRSVATWSGKS